MRVCTPPPQLTSHLPQSAHWPSTQSTGQSCRPPETHVARWVKAGQTSPLHDGCVVVVRARVLTPWSQVLEHCDHVPHSDSTQFTGQQPVLQARWSSSVGQAAPPLADPIRIVRNLVCEPPPQLLSQEP